MTQYRMTPILSGTRLRTNHNTFANIITSFNMGEALLGDELWEATEDGSEVKAGDKWLHVTHRNGLLLPQPGWTAYIHKGGHICNNFEVIGETPSPSPAVFPDSFTLTAPDGSTAEYKKI